MVQYISLLVLPKIQKEKLLTGHHQFLLVLIHTLSLPSSYFHFFYDTCDASLFLCLVLYVITERLFLKWGMLNYIDCCYSLKYELQSSEDTLNVF